MLKLIRPYIIMKYFLFEMVLISLKKKSLLTYEINLKIQFCKRLS